MAATKSRLLVVPAAETSTIELPQSLNETFEIVHGPVAEHLIQDEEDNFQLVLMEAKHLKSVLKRISWVETLTGIPSREYLSEMLASEWRRNARNRTSISFFMMEPDQFDDYYQQYGKKAGDEVQQRIVSAMANGIQRAGDVVGRFKDHRIACILPETDTLGAVAVAERIRAAVNEMQIQREGAKFRHLTLSIGVASLIPGRSDLLNDFILQAASCLEKAAARGGNQVVFS